MLQKSKLSSTVLYMTERTTEDASEYLTPRAASERAAVHPRTLARLAEQGKIRSYTLPSGHRRYNRADVEALTEQVSA